MSNYQSRLDGDLEVIRTRLGRVAQVVREAVDESIAALVAHDKERLYLVMLNDLPINRETRAIDGLCHAFIARHLPAAGPLRFVSSALRLSIALERIGDYAVTVARVGVKLSQKPPKRFIDELTGLTVNACHMLQDATDAFIRGDAELARETARRAKKIDRRHDEFFNEIVSDDGIERPVLEIVSLLTIIGKLERVSDQAKNMCEEAVFVTTGQTKKPKVYKVLFVDETNALLSQLCVAIAQKSFPESGTYESCGWNPASEADPRLREISESFALGLDHPKISPVQPFRESPAEYHVIVSLNGGKTPPLPNIPFHSVLLNWTVDPSLRADDLVRELSGMIQSLLITLRGENAP
jgi:phosphate transport system protein